MIVIIGNGISGITAARTIRKRSSEPITIISSESKYFFSRTALMYVYMGHLKFEHTQPYEPQFWKKNNIELIEDHIIKVDTTTKTIIGKNGTNISYDSLILCTGSKPNKFGWKGQDSHGVSGLYSKQDLEYIEQRSSTMKKAVIVGGGLIGIELAEMLCSRNIEVHFLVRENLFWNNVLPDEDATFIMRHLTKHHGLFMHYNCELEEIKTDESSNVIGIRTTDGEELDCDFVGLTAGVSPNIDFLKSSSIETNRGVLINSFFETSEKDVYAIGDCAEFETPLPGRRSIEQVWYTGKIMGESLGKTLTGERTKYNPGHWFNSAKFFDLEYQTYGTVNNKLKEGQAKFIYINNEAEVMLHFVFDQITQKFIGINSFGIRLRHVVFNQWLINEATITDVLTNLRTANFDPEFFKRFEADIIQKFNEQFDSKIQLAKTKWWQSILQH